MLALLLVTARRTISRLLMILLLSMQSFRQHLMLTEQWSLFEVRSPSLYDVVFGCEACVQCFQEGIFRDSCHVRGCFLNC